MIHLNKCFWVFLTLAGSCGCGNNKTCWTKAMQQCQTVVFLFDLVEFRPPFLLLRPQNVHIYFTGPRRAPGVPGGSRIGARVSTDTVLP